MANIEFTQEEVEELEVVIDGTLMMLGANEDAEEIKLLNGILKKIREGGDK
ncbi:MAG: hypothetical protein ACXABY_30975 [Candidatus Thorarchaeota archaeon]|jgi:hypothetical protein